MVTALAFLKSVPSWAWVAIAAVLLVAGAYFKGASDKDQQWQDRLAKAEAAAALAAEKAMNEADSEAEKRALAFGAQQAALRGAINEAEATGSNAITDLFNSMSARSED